MSDEEAPDGGLSSSIASSEGKLVGVGIVFDESVKDRYRPGCAFAPFPPGD